MPGPNDPDDDYPFAELDDLYDLLDALDEAADDEDLRR